mmetsp:Transcript_54909/g.120077  ORF Transcript_54909/g.120077 Transcript_54909/m.120077 type:complete len:92 (+) Transcript_54909:176-451(+)
MKSATEPCRPMEQGSPESTSKHSEIPNLAPTLTLRLVQRSECPEVGLVKDRYPYMWQKNVLAQRTHMPNCCNSSERCERPASAVCHNRPTG